MILFGRTYWAKKVARQAGLDRHPAARRWVISNLAWGARESAYAGRRTKRQCVLIVGANMRASLPKLCSDTGVSILDGSAVLASVRTASLTIAEQAGEVELLAILQHLAPEDDYQANTWSGVSRYRFRGRR